MSIALYFDNNVRDQVLHGLRRRGIDILIAREDGTARLDDERLLERATELRRALFSHDKDLPSIAGRWIRDGKDFAGLIYVEQTRLSNRETIEDLYLIASVYDPVHMFNHIEYLPL